VYKILYGHNGNIKMGLSWLFFGWQNSDGIEFSAQEKCFGQTSNIGPLRAMLKPSENEWVEFIVHTIKLFLQLKLKSRYGHDISCIGQVYLKSIISTFSCSPPSQPSSIWSRRAKFILSALPTSFQSAPTWAETTAKSSKVTGRLQDIIFM